MSTPPTPPLANLLLAAEQFLRAARFPDAIAMADRAIATSPQPVAQAHVVRGTALVAMGKLAEGIEAFRATLTIAPDDVEAALSLGTALARAGDAAGAIAAWQEILRHHPREVRAHGNLLNLHLHRGEWDEATRHADAALQIDPNQPAIYNSLGNMHSTSGRSDEAIEMYRRAIALAPTKQGPRANLLLNLHYSSRVTPEQIFVEHKRWDEDIHQALNVSPMPFANTKDPNRRIRVGYVSADFREHPVAQFIASALEGHNRANVDVFCYSGVPNEDEVTRRFRRAVENWRPIVGVKHPLAVEMIRRDRIDILVDLAGHSAGNRLLMFAHRAAPVQVTYLGYPDTTGLREMDYRITDAVSDPPGETERFHTERLVRLPDSFLCYAPPLESPPVSPLPALEGNAAITFGSFNNFSKVSDATIAMWAAVLRAVPCSRMLIKANGLGILANRQRTVERFAARGIDAHRLELRPITATVMDHLATYHHVDVGLDAFPYHGTTTTCEALWMGVPTITLTGRAHVSRVGTSIMRGIGLPEFAVDSEEEFVARAVEKANDISALASVRDGMRARLLSSPLLDRAGFVRKLENAYREMWTTWCGSK